MTRAFMGIMWKKCFLLFLVPSSLFLDLQLYIWKVAQKVFMIFPVSPTGVKFKLSEKRKKLPT